MYGVLLHVVIEKQRYLPPGRSSTLDLLPVVHVVLDLLLDLVDLVVLLVPRYVVPVSYTHLRAHET